MASQSPSGLRSCKRSSLPPRRRLLLRFRRRPLLPPAALLVRVLTSLHPPSETT